MQIFRFFLFLCNRELVAWTPGLIPPLSKGTVITVDRRVSIPAQDAISTETRQVILPFILTAIKRMRWNIAWAIKDRGDIFRGEMR